MLPKDSRVRLRADIERVMRKGRSFSSPFFSLRILMRGGSDAPRFGFIVSNKISKKAVVRNRIKRRLRESVRRVDGEFPPQSDVIVIARPPLVNADSTHIRAELDVMLSRFHRR